MDIIIRNGDVMALDSNGLPILTLTLRQQETILTYLGYTHPSVYHDWARWVLKLNAVYAEVLVERVAAILSELAEIDSALVSARSESMAKVVDKLELDYKQHLKHLNRDGNGLLKELANLLDLQVIYSKYARSNRQTSIVAWG